MLTELLQTMRTPLVRHTSDAVTVVASLPRGAFSAWWPVPESIRMAARAPHNDEISVVADVLSRLGMRSYDIEWRRHAGKALPVDVSVAPAKLVKDGDELVSVRGDSMFFEPVLRRIFATTVTSTMVMSVLSIIEHCKRLSSRLGEASEWADKCVIINTHDHFSEFVANTLLGQRPNTLDGALLAETTSGAEWVIATPILKNAAAREAYIAHHPRGSVIWHCDSAREFQEVMASDCIPIVPLDRDISFVMKFAEKRVEGSKLKTLEKRIAFYSSSALDAKQSFSSLSSVGVSPSMTLSLLSLRASEQMPVRLTDGWNSALPDVSALTIPDIAAVQSVIVS